MTIAINANIRQTIEMLCNSQNESLTLISLIIEAIVKTPLKLIITQSIVCSPMIPLVHLYKP